MSTIGLVYMTYENGYVYIYIFFAIADSSLFLLMCKIYIMICIFKTVEVCLLIASMFERLI